MYTNGSELPVFLSLSFFRYGSGVFAKQHGFYFNNQLSDFTQPRNNTQQGVKQSKANYIKPGKRPMSSACPTIYIDENGNVVSLVAGAGNMAIISAVNSVSFLLKSYILHS